ncbi:unnamed protein product [Penicillium egyptiacum]|uniref:NAD-dependent epimerase/dehydratase domain-containing protein n=1 Tax=Penicillium egyptiacum TaxID=1303716 RepID=A0A9W4KNP7_9EURO|nr:unnamed protein product [Penicillium egyptiacum]
MNVFALHPGARVLVTGANGFIASHTINELLKLGYRVRGTVRNPKPWLDDHFTHRYGPGMFQTAPVASFQDSREIDAALDDVDGIVHLVAPWARKATLSVLEAALGRPSIQRVVLGSSSMAAYTPIPGKREIRVDESTWNLSAIRKAWETDSYTTSTPDVSHLDWNSLSNVNNAPSPRNQHEYAKMLITYGACKTQCELEAWRWVRSNRCSFGFNTVLPAFTVGRILHPQIPGSTMGWVRSLLIGNRTPLSLIPPKWFVDVEDVARLFVVALLAPSVTSERLFAFGESTNWTDVVRILRQLDPGNTQIPIPPEREERDHAEIVPRGRAVRLLQQFYGQSSMTPIATSIANGIPKDRLLGTV